MMTIFQHLVMAQDGVFRGKQSECLVVTQGDGKVAPPTIR
jgi:hypothetical protein